MSKQELRDKIFDKAWEENQAEYLIKLEDLFEILDDYEALSQEWIERRQGWHLEPSVPAGELQNLLVPKQEKTVIPQFVADVIELYKKYGMALTTLLADLAYHRELRVDSIDDVTSDTMFDWADENSDAVGEIIARAWLNGYTTEKEPKYYVIFPAEVRHRVLDDQGLFVERDFNYLATNGKDYWVEDARSDDLSWEERSSFTEQEIKDYDERYFQFAVPVEEVDTNG